MMRNQPFSLVQAMHKNLFLKVFCSFYICLFLGIALPAHHHSDGVDHDNCALCILQNQAPTTETVFSLACVVGIPVELFQPPIKFHDPRLIFAFHSRAPPASTLS
jgi:hypothetical protein